MYFIYLDESGNTGKDLNSDQQPVHFISGLIIDSENLQTVEASVKSLLPIFLPDSSNYDFEFHGKDMLHGKKYFKNFDVESRLNTFKSLVEIVKKYDIKFISQGINKKLHRKKYINPYHPHNVAFMYLIEKVDNFLEEKKSKGLIIMDKNREKEQEIVNDFRLYKEKGTSYGFFKKEEIRNFFDNVFYVESFNSYLLQLADVIGFLYAVNRLSKMGVGGKDTYHRKYVLELAEELKEIIYYKSIDP